MKPAADKLIVNLNQIKIEKPQISIIHNVDLEIHDNADDIRDALIKQLYKPVRWTETIQLMSDEKINTFVEIGSGRVLTGLNKRIVKTNTYLYTDNLASFHQVLESLA
jgi:[acyl-carrier-protein] S-malonyltransferase